MKTVEILRAWGHILRGQAPSLSLEITRECPLRCPGCYAYEEEHLGGSGLQLRTLADYKGDDLVRRTLALVDELKPLHLSIVGGDPLVLYRELTRLLPELEKRDIHTQVVTSAFREIPASWSEIRKLNISVSVDGLQSEHDARRKPATYSRILKNIAGHLVTIHCTVTGQMMKRSGYLREFVELWSANPNVKRIWFSIFTPQIGATSPEILTPAERAVAITDMLALRQEFPKLDMKASVIRHFADPPRSPQECIFARTTTTISADFKTRVTPCQFGGNPDCSQCGCIASAGLAALGDHKVLLGISAGRLFQISAKIGQSAVRPDL
jgi:MoaA/NifB/PqqE/SkfB family radical SAM enzyme